MYFQRYNRLALHCSPALLTVFSWVDPIPVLFQTALVPTSMGQSLELQTMKWTTVNTTRTLSICMGMVKLVLEDFIKFFFFKSSLIHSYRMYMPSRFRYVQLFVTLGTVAQQAPLRLCKFYTQGLWRGCHALLQGIFST